MLKIQVATTDITNGNIAVAWCLDEETLKYLGDKKIQDPQIVICVSPVENYHSAREYRKVVSLKDLMTYLEFRTSGENRIWAFISEKNHKDARNSYLSKEGGIYNTSILDVDGTGWSSIFNAKYVPIEGGYMVPKYFSYNYAEPITVDVPAAVFATEPPKWEKVWVNHWFRSKPQDQCDYRRRRLLAYTVQPIVMLLDVLVARTLLSLVATLWLSRGLSFKYFTHPLTYNLAETTDVFRGGTWTVPHLPEDNHIIESEDTFYGFISYLFRKFWKAPLMPLVAFPLWLIYHFHVVLWALAIITTIMSFMFLSFLLASGLVRELIDNIFEWYDSRQDSKCKVSVPWYLQQEEMQVITCNKAFEKRTSVDALPAKHRTISLHFQNIKAKICRPFSA